jgi:hypothetical protein
LWLDCVGEAVTPADGVVPPIRTRSMAVVPFIANRGFPAPGAPALGIVMDGWPAGWMGLGTPPVARTTAGLVQSFSGELTQVNSRCGQEFVAAVSTVSGGRFSRSRKRRMLRDGGPDRRTVSAEMGCELRW